MRGRPILLSLQTLTDRIGHYSVLLPLLIKVEVRGTLSAKAKPGYHKSLSIC